MSEPTGGSTQRPDPDSNRSPQGDADPEPGTNRDEPQDQVPDSLFTDPTAPVWADPTTPIPPMPPVVPVPPVPPTPPGAASSYSEQPAAFPYGQQQTPPDAPSASNPDAPSASNPDAPSASNPDAPSASNPYAPSASNPYSQPPPAQTGQEASAYDQQYPAYGQQPPAYGQQPPAPPGQYPSYGQQPYATGPQPEANASGIVLTILSAIVMLSTCFIIGTPSLVFGIMALTSNSTDPLGSRKKAKTGWIILAINFGVVVLIAVAGLALLAANSTGSSSGSSY